MNLVFVVFTSKFSTCPLEHRNVMEAIELAELGFTNR
jgi:hypothetical protein